MPSLMGVSALFLFTHHELKAVNFLQFAALEKIASQSRFWHGSLITVCPLVIEMMRQRPFPQEGKKEETTGFRSIYI